MAIDLIVPKLGESISEAVVAKWLKKVGDSVAIDEPIVDLETDKVSVTLPSPAAGVISELKVTAGTTVNIGDVIALIAVGTLEPRPVAPVAAAPASAPAVAPTSASAPVPSAAIAVVAAPPAPAAVTESASSNGSRPLPPSVRRALREHEGEAHASVSAAVAPAAAPAAALAPAPRGVASAREEVVAMTPIRKRIAERLVAAQHTAAILTTFNEVDMSAVLELRARYQDDFTKRHGVKLGMMSFFVKAAVESLKEFPGLNAELRGNDIVYKKHYDFGVAVGGGKGLVVPVVRDVDALGFAEIEKAIAALAVKAKDNKLTLDELSGGTFSITNGGIYGSMMSTPLLNMPQTGILGMHNIIKRPIAVGDAVAIRPMMYLALSYDHRVVDGREAVQFLIGIKQRVENPDRLLFAI